MGRFDRIQIFAQTASDSRLIAGLCAAAAVMIGSIAGWQAGAAFGAAPADVMAKPLAGAEVPIHKPAPAVAGISSNQGAQANSRLRIRSIGTTHSIRLEPAVMIDGEDALLLAGWATAMQRTVNQYTGAYVNRIITNNTDGAALTLSTRTGTTTLGIEAFVLSSGRVLSLGDAATFDLPVIRKLTATSCAWLAGGHTGDGNALCPGAVHLASQ